MTLRKRGLARDSGDAFAGLTRGLPADSRVATDWGSPLGKLVLRPSAPRHHRFEVDRMSESLRHRKRVGVRSGEPLP